MTRFPLLKSWFSGVIRAASSVGGGLPPALQPIITPQARDRWLSTRVANYTPEEIETVLRGALAGDLKQQFELFDLMEETWPRLQKNLNDLKDTVVSLDWGLQPWSMGEEEPTPSAVERKKFIEAALWQMRPNPARDQNHFEATLKDILDAWGKGLAVLEVNWELGQLGKQPAILPRSTAWVHPRYYGYAFNAAHLQLNGRELATSITDHGSRITNWQDFPEHKFLIAVAKQKSGHPIGSALLRALAWWWASSNFAASWLLNFAQIFGLPIRWATYDPNRPGLLAKVSEMLANMGSAAWAAFPAGTTFELKESSKSGGGADTPQGNLLDRADTQCDLLILGQTLTSNVTDSGGNRALGEVHERVRGDRIMAAARFVATVLNYQLIPSICALNFGNTEECPYFQPAAREVKDAKGLAERDEILTRLGIRFPKRWLYERHEIPEPGPSEETLGTAPPSSDPSAPSAPTDSSEIQAKSAAASENTMQSIVEEGLAQGLGARRRWLAPLREEIQRLIATAKDARFDDADVTRLIRAGQERLPELFEELDPAQFSEHLNKVAGAAALQGLQDAKA